jgi:hypothetical protein
MPTIAQRQAYDGAEERISRLGLTPLNEEIVHILTDFSLLVAERRDANSAAAVRTLIDERFEQSGGWTQRQTGDVDWVKCLSINGARVCLGVEVQISARSDLLIVDIVHLRDQINAGRIDVGFLVTASDELSTLLNDGEKSFSAALNAVWRLRANYDVPLIILGLLDDRI